MICPKCTHTMNDDLVYCECCGTLLAAPQPHVRTIPMSTYRFDLYEQPEGGTPSPSGTQESASFYPLYESTPVNANGGALGVQPAVAGMPTGSTRKPRRSRRMKTLFTVGLISMLLMGFGGGMTAFATDEANNRMPLIVEYEEIFASDEPMAIDGTEVPNEVVILDDLVPLAAPTHESHTPSDAALPSSSTESESQLPGEQPSAMAATFDQHQVEAAEDTPLAPCTLDVNGTRVSYIRSLFAPVCPDRNAALWAGDDDTADDSFGYFVGHNPGDFACAYALTKGDRVTLCNAGGSLHDYTVTQLLDIPSTTFFEELVENVIPAHESLVIQTCIGDGSQYRIIVCE